MTGLKASVSTATFLRRLHASASLPGKWLTLRSATLNVLHGFLKVLLPLRIDIPELLISRDVGQPECLAIRSFYRWQLMSLYIQNCEDQAVGMPNRSLHGAVQQDVTSIYETMYSVPYATHAAWRQRKAPAVLDSLNAQVLHQQKHRLALLRWGII